MIKKIKVVLISVVFLSCYVASGFAQQHNPPPVSHYLQKYRPGTYVKLRGEVNLTSYGAAMSFPVLWVENRVKLVPLVGIFWEDFAADGEDTNPAIGAKILYYFHKQFIHAPSFNSFYAGIAGMSSDVNYFGRTIAQRSRVSLILGYSRVLNPLIHLAPELQLGVNNDGDFRLGAGLVFHF